MRYAVQTKLEFPADYHREPVSYIRLSWNALGTAMIPQRFIEALHKRCLVNSFFDDLDPRRRPSEPDSLPSFAFLSSPFPESKLDFVYCSLYLQNGDLDNPTICPYFVSPPPAAKYPRSLAESCCRRVTKLRCARTFVSHFPIRMNTRPQ